MTDSNALLTAALRYAASGWQVFPCLPGGKQPLTPNGFHDATANPQTIYAWWQQWPDANLGIACGASGLVVIDADGKSGHDGIESWHDLLGELGHDCGETATVETPGPGLHLYYRATDREVRNSASKLGPGLDVRGVGGYVIAPPSVHPNGGTYNWALGADPTETPLRVLPDELADRLGVPARPARPVTAANTTSPTPGLGYLWLSRALDRAQTGNRNATGFWLSCQLRDADVDRDDAEELLIQYARGVPQRENDPYTEDEALHSLEEAYEAPTRAPAHNLSPIVPTVDYALAQALSDPQVVTELAKLPLTDAGNAEAFFLMNGARFRHMRLRPDGGGDWLTWGRHYWRRARRGETQRAALGTIRARLAASATITDDSIRAASYKHARQSESRYSLGAMLDLAHDICPILATLPEDYNVDPWLLSCANGVVDLRSGDLRPGRPEDRITLSTHVHYDPTAECPRWQQFLREVFENDTALIDYVQKAAGYSLTADTREPALFLCWGHGRNGKTTLLNVIRKIAGDYGSNTPFSTFEMDSRAAIPNDVAALAGKRLVTASETSESSRLNEARIKAITGRDPITARFLHGEFFTYDPTYHIWLAMNHKPRVTGTDEGIWSRIKLIPFLVSFKGREDKELDATLETELPGILHWAVEGCLRWQSEGLEEPPAVSLATKEYRAESDTFLRFVQECCVVHRNAYVTSADLRNEYESWCAENGERQVARGNTLTGRLSEMGCQPRLFKIDGTPKRTWFGIGLLTDPVQADLIGTSSPSVTPVTPVTAQTGLFTRKNLACRENTDLTVTGVTGVTGAKESDLAGGNGASTPMMITRRMRDFLVQAGYLDSEIATLTPAEAWERIERAGGLPAEPQGGEAAS